MTKKLKTAKAVAIKSESITDKVDPKPAAKQPVVKNTKTSAVLRTNKGSARKNSKQAQVLEMLQRAGGVAISQIMDATGWQQHSVRGFLSGAIKKKLGLKVVSEKAKNGIRTYRVKTA